MRALVRRSADSEDIALGDLQIPTVDEDELLVEAGPSESVLRMAQTHGARGKPVVPLD